MSVLSRRGRADAVPILRSPRVPLNRRATTSDASSRNVDEPERRHRTASVPDPGCASSIHSPEDIHTMAETRRTAVLSCPNS